MREIRFRVWDGLAMLHTWDGWSQYIDILDEAWVIVQDDYKYAVMQYTGLKDKNGVEIYEGDVIELEADSNKIYWNVPHNLQYGDRCVVEWSDVNLAYYLMPLNEEREEQQMDYFGAWSGWNWIKVIGNIYQNTELLEGHK